jgi:formate dehydrogenase maturation protein FdhE
MTASHETHYPHRNGPACGRDKGRGADIQTPTDARDYSVNAPTCEKCAAYLKVLLAQKSPSASA